MINCRRKAREAALQALYQCDALADWSESCVELYFKEFQSEIAEHPEDHKENIDFARELVRGVIANLDFLDAQISTSSRHWSLTRMSRVDRNIIRFAAFEIGFISDIPASVTINEAIEISKRFSSDDAPMFINGVLDNIAEVFSHNSNLSHKVASSRERKKKVVNS